MKERGQFYLIGAVVIIMIIIGFVVITNYSKTTSSTKIYDLAEELEIESAYVIDYGIISGVDAEGMESMLESFVAGFEEEFGAEIIDEYYYIFADEENIIFVGYQQLKDILSANIALDQTDFYEILLKKKTITSETIPEENVKEIVIILDYGDEEEEFSFILNEGDNLYLIISDVHGEEKDTHIS